MRVIKFDRNKKLYSLDDTFNIIISGQVLDQATGKMLKRFDMFSD